MSVSINYRPPGPVAAAFMQDRSFLSGLLGPVGSGKSTCAAMKMFTLAMEQKPFNGVRDTRWIVVRNTYGELRTTTIKTWLDWFPAEPGGINTMRWDSPITSTIQFALGGGETFRMEVMFLALDRADDVGKLRSLEATGAWLNEASLLPKEVLDMVTQRVGRFPSLRHGGPTNICVLLDTNPPDDDHWYYKAAEEKTPSNWKFFKQPGGLMIIGTDPEGRPQFGINPQAENVFNLPRGYEYYLNQLGGKTDDWIKVFLCGLYGTTLAGKVVYPEWRDSFHVAKEALVAIPGVPLRLGWDFGLTPACIIGQMSPTGQLRIIEEIVAEDMGIRQMAREVVKPTLLNKYPNFSFESLGDPAGNTRVQTDEKTCLQELLACGIATESAPTNSFIARREAVAFFLNASARGEPGFLLSPECVVLRKGFNGGYRYERLRISGIAARYRDSPTKDKFSHPHDGLQYLALGLRDPQNDVRARNVVHTNPGGWT